MIVPIINFVELESQLWLWVNTDLVSWINCSHRENDNDGKQALTWLHVSIAGDARVTIIEGEGYWRFQIEVQVIVAYHFQQV